jgi:two-component system, LytTR family, sensor kinase
MPVASEPAIWPIVRRAFAQAPPEVRTQAAVIGMLWLLMVALQIWDSSDGRGAAGLAEFLSAILGSSGAALLGVVHTLQRVMEHRANASARLEETTGVQQVLLALPALGFTAGVALGAATVLMVIRTFLGAELPLTVVGGTWFLLLTIWAGRTVMVSTRSLFRHAEANAAAAARAHANAAEARLATLTAQMNPHFLFNALNTIAALTATSPASASRATENLAGILRRTLERSASASGTVEEEIDYVRAYLELEQERWGSRLRVSWHVDPRTEPLSMPPLVLQPLVENALRHGIGGRAEGGLVSIHIDRNGDSLRVRVSDDGGGFPPGYRERTGLHNLRERLAVLYGDAAKLEITVGTGGTAVLTLPAAAASPSTKTRRDGRAV